MKAGSLTSWREKLGFSQKVLAEYIGVSRGLVNLVERGERELPVPAFLLVTQLVRNYETATPAPIPPERSQPARQKSAAMLNQLIAETTWQLGKIKGELAAMDADYKRTLCQIHVLHTTRQQLADNPNTPTSNRQRLWLGMKEEELWQTIESISPEAQIPLQLRMVTLKASLEEAKLLMETLVVGQESGEEAADSF